MTAGALLIITGVGLATSAGLNAYIPLLIAGFLARFGVFELAAPVDVLSTNVGLAIVGTLLVVEFFADKIPGVDHLNDVVQSFVRPASGAALVAGTVGPDSGAATALAVIVGLATAGGVHGVKAAARPAVNASTAGLGAPVVSVVEDVISTVTAFLAILVPLLFLLFAVVFIVLMVRWLRRRTVRRRDAAAPDPGVG